MSEVNGSSALPQEAALGIAPQCQVKNSCKDFSNWFLRFNANSLNCLKYTQVFVVCLLLPP